MAYLFRRKSNNDPLGKVLNPKKKRSTICIAMQNLLPCKQLKFINMNEQRTLYKLNDNNNRNDFKLIKIEFL